MKKGLRRIRICFLLVAAIWTVVMIADREKRDDMLSHFHMIVNAETKQVQQLDSQICGEALTQMRKDLQNIINSDIARAYLQENLPKIEKIAKKTIQSAGVDEWLSEMQTEKNAYQFPCFWLDILDNGRIF